MVDHSRSNRIVKAAHDRGDIKPLAAAHPFRARLCASGDPHLVILGETLTDGQLDTLLAWGADGTLKKIRDDKAH